MNKRRRIASRLLAVGWAATCWSAAQAIVFYETGDPNYNTTQPGGALADSGWQWQWQWGDFLGTPVHPKYFLTARHIGGKVGDALVLGDQSRVTTAFVDVPGSDLRLWRICGEFADYAPLHANGNTVGRTLVWLGRGTQRGTPVLLTNGLTAEVRGWQPGQPDHRLRWGQNRVEEIHLDETWGPLLRATFDAGDGPDECHLTTGDSGGGAFVREGVRWELAGIHLAVDGPYRYPDGGEGFAATLFNHQGFYWENDGEWVPVTERPEPEAGALYATDVSAHAEWILDYLSRALLEEVPTLQQSTEPSRGYTDVSNAEINPLDRTIRLPRPILTMFYRLRGCVPHRITEVLREDEALALVYE